MGNFVQFLIGTTLVLIYVSLINVNSSPTNDGVIVHTLSVEPEKKHKIVECSIDAECGNGKCLNATVCLCDRGWTTHGNIPGKAGHCKYNQRSKQTAFFLSFFAGFFGAEWFYLSRSNFAYIIAGILKLLLGCGCCGGWPLSYFGPEIQNSESVKSKLRGVNTCFSLLAFAWWILDWGRLVGNKFPDGNGAGLIPW